MQVARPVGRGAAARKYDILTALGAYALAHGKPRERTVLRLITLIVARYNWPRDELAVGQREIARLWSVDERTVKREMARLRAFGWLEVKRQGARGRVTEYRLVFGRILDETQPHWAAVGPDYELRMGAPDPAPERIVPFPGARVAAPDVSDGSEWTLAAAALHGEDAALYGAWFAALTREGRDGGRLTLRAPSRFHGAYVQTHLTARLLRAVQAVDVAVSEVVIIA